MQNILKIVRIYIGIIWNNFSESLRGISPYSKIFLITAILSVWLKVWISSFGGNADLESWQIVGDIVRKGQTIYDNTARYNYGPLWGYICGGIAWVVLQKGAINVYDPIFHKYVAFLLALVDVAIAAVIYKQYSKIGGILFLINPVSAVLTGSHSQFDNLAILVGLVGWVMYSKGNKNMGILVLGISMMFKHILLFFPIWIVLHEVFSNQSNKTKVVNILKVASIYLIFASGFMFEILRGYDHREPIIAAILKNVIMYRGYGVSLGNAVINFFVPPTIFELSQYVPVFKGNMFFYMLIAVAVGIISIIKKIETKYLLPIYLLTFFAFSFSEARQYFAIPLVAVFIFYDRLESVIYTLLAAIYVSTNAFATMAQSIKADMYVDINGYEFLMFPWTHKFVLTYTNVQIWILVLLISIFIFSKIRFIQRYATTLYLLVFIVSYVSIGTYLLAVKNTSDRRNVTIISQTSDYVKFTCSKRNNWIYRYFVLHTKTAANEKVVSELVKCPYTIPTW